MDRILVVEDERISLKTLQKILRQERYEVTTAESGEEAVHHLDTKPIDLVVTDLVMTPMDGLAVLARAKERNPATEVIVMTGYASVDTAIEAMKMGAFHYLPKPFQPDELRHLVRQALEKRRLKMQVAELQQRDADEAPRLLGNSPQIVAIRRLIRQIAPTDSNVLITGASGTGKELVASAIHHLSPRKDRRFLPINCASFTEELLANELFGHEKDAFTGATSTRGGLLEAANGGTIFFDEVGDMPLAMQAKLLRVIQERELIRVGGSRPVQIDVRIISATNKDLRLALKHGNFREDLYYRLNVVPVAMPPLAERKEDIPLLAAHFLSQFCRRTGRFLGFSREAMDLLCSYDYPGNIRELVNIVERTASLSPTEIVGVDVMPDDLKELDVHTVDSGAEHLKTLREVEEDYIQEVLVRCHHNKSRAAKVLGINRVSLHRKLKRTQISE